MKRASNLTLTRRHLFASGAAAALTTVTSAHARVPAGKNVDYVYEITKTDEEWMAELGEYGFAIMREGFTEKAKSSPLWEETRQGTYHCGACDLHVYDSSYKVVLDKGWVFFYHALPATVMMNVDGIPPEYGGGGMATGADDDLIEVHCRRCGSHLGHLVNIAGGIKHCINGESLTFKEAAA